MSDDGDKPEAPVIRLVTAPPVDQQREEYAVASRAEVISMLDQALRIARGRPVAAIAIAFAFEDGSFGSIVPELGTDVGRLLGAVSDMEYRINVNNNSRPRNPLDT